MIVVQDVQSLCSGAMLRVGILVMDQTLNMLGMTSMFVGGFMALILDNMIPGLTKLQPFCTWTGKVMMTMSQ